MDVITVCFVATLFQKLGVSKISKCFLKELST